MRLRDNRGKKWNFYVKDIIICYVINEIWYMWKFMLKVIYLIYGWKCLVKVVLKWWKLGGVIICVGFVIVVILLYDVFGFFLRWMFDYYWIF